MAAPPRHEHPAHPDHPEHGGHADNVVQDDATAQQKLTDAGFTAVSVTRRGPNWVGTATNAAGAAAHVVVHGRDGRISEDDTPEPDPDPA